MRHAAARFAVAAALLTAALVLRGPSFVPAVIDIDEGLYMLQAREWLRGGLPYVAAWDMHPVGAPALFALSGPATPRMLPLPNGTSSGRPRLFFSSV